MTEALLRAGAKTLARTLRDAGHEAYFAGGCVRDVLLGKSPKDFDIATDATPEEVQKIFRRTVAVGAAFGVIRVRIGHGQEYEVATYRTDGEYTDGRRPDVVRYSKSKEEDVARRDFTINALLMDPFTDEILDFVGGQADLARRMIRAVGDPERRFFEDKLRMLRAVRFASRFDFEIDSATRAAIQKHASSIVLVSAERIVTELSALWNGADPGLGMRLLAELELFSPIFSFVPAESLASVCAEIARIPEACASVGAAEADARSVVAWALLLARRDLRHESEAVLRSMKLSQRIMKDVERALGWLPSLEAPESLRLADRVRILRDRLAPTALAFLAARGGTDNAALRLYLAERVALEQDPLPAEPWVTGGDLKRLGLDPSPRFKTILESIETEVFERRIKTKEEAQAMAERLAKEA